MLPPCPEGGEVSDRAPVTEDEAPEDGIPEDATVETSAHDEEAAASEAKVSGSSVEGSSSSHTSTSPPEAVSPDKRKRKRSSDVDDSESSEDGKESLANATPVTSATPLNIFGIAQNVSS